MFKLVHFSFFLKLFFIENIKSLASSFPHECPHELQLHNLYLCHDLPCHISNMSTFKLRGTEGIHLENSLVILSLLFLHNPENYPSQLYISTPFQPFFSAVCFRLYQFAAWKCSNLCLDIQNCITYTAMKEIYMFTPVFIIQQDFPSSPYLLTCWKSFCIFHHAQTTSNTPSQSQLCLKAPCGEKFHHSP